MIMKKIKLISIIAISFFFFACASSTAPETSTEDLAPETENVENQDDATIDAEISEQETPAIDITKTEENTIDSPIEEQTTDTFLTFEELEEIEEPLVRDLIPEETPVIENNEPEVSEEPVQAEELEPIETEVLLPQEDIIFLDDEPSSESELSVKVDKAADSLISNPEVEAAADTAAESESAAETLESDNSEVENPDNSDTEEISDATDTEDETIEEEPTPVIIPSRKVTLKRNEQLVITYPGANWIYMGSLDEFNNMANKGRKLGAADTKYTLLAKNPGTQIHHFYKEDNLTGNYIDDYIEITVLEQKGKSSTIVEAPEYRSIVPPQPEESKTSEILKEQNSEAVPLERTVKKEKTSPVKAEEEKEQKKEEITNTAAAAEEDEIISDSNNQNNDDDIMFILEPADIDSDALIAEAEDLFNKKEYEAAMNKLNDFLDFSSTRRDEALYLQGQIYEQNSPLKDIKAAINAYQILIDYFPASALWDSANKRIIYLKRFYIEVR